MYVSPNFKTKKALKEAVRDYLQTVGTPLETRPVRIFQPGLGAEVRNGTASVEGPHYPKPHTWYGQVTVKDGIVIKVT